MATVNLTVFQFGQNNLNSAQVMIEGNEATVRIPSSRNPSRSRSHKMVKQAGGWRLDVDSTVESLSEVELAVFNEVGHSLEQSIKDVQAGKYGSIEAAVQALQANAMAAARANR